MYTEYNYMYMSTIKILLYNKKYSYKSLYTYKTMIKRLI